MDAPKTLDLDDTVHDLCTRNPGLIPLLASLGFPDIVKPGMLATAGRFMTLPKGAALKRIDLGAIVHAFEEHGYTVLKKEKPS
jgi:hypothetical protein